MTFGALGPSNENVPVPPQDEQSIAVGGRAGTSALSSEYFKLP